MCVWERVWLSVSVTSVQHLHVDNMCQPIWCFQHHFCPPMQCSWQHRCESKWATNRSIHLYWWATILHRSMVAGRRHSPSPHCCHLQRTFSHNAHGSAHRPTHSGTIRTVAEMLSLPDASFWLWPICAFYEIFDGPSPGTEGTHISEITIQTEKDKKRLFCKQSHVKKSIKEAKFIYFCLRTTNISSVIPLTPHSCCVFWCKIYGKINRNWM